ncbi:hypothetical protein F4811DRAFT_547724 [Daldinia bambusicola]|nr:hypothetical protein F4811DRAFT_547724 [Daldinia bambusicola]
MPKKVKTNTRKRAFGEVSVIYTPWHKAINNLSNFLYICKPEIHLDDSCTEEDILRIVARAAVSEYSQDRLLDFFSSAPKDKWYCLDEVAEGWSYTAIDEACSKCKRGRCLQIHNLNVGEMGGLTYGAFSCRKR